MIEEYARHNGHTDLITPARDAWVVLRRLINRGEVPTIPTVVTAQAWRDGRRQVQLARALGACRPESLSDELARKAGELFDVPEPPTSSTRS